MKTILLIFSLMLMSTVSLAGFEGLQDGASLKIFNRINCSTGLTCSRGANGLFTVLADGSFSRSFVTATATTITSSQCGSSFANTGAVQMELPEVSTVSLGCRLTFITGNASNFDVNPDNADQILVETDAAGDAIRNAVLGNSITLEAISASQWAPVATVGTWADIN